MTGARVILNAVKDPPGFFGGPQNDTWRKQLAKRGRFDKDSPFCLPQQLNHTRLLSRLSGE